MDKDEFVLVARFPVAEKAHIARGKLEAEGIPSFVGDQHSPKITPGLWVPRPYAEQAKRILAELPGLFELPR